MVSKLIYGVGVNDSDYITQKSKVIRTEDGKRVTIVLWRCPFYDAWTNMLARCLSSKRKSRNPTYTNATCCEEWLIFSNFKAWMETQDWKGKCLDKDIIVKSNKHYSPETCAFVSKLVNGFVVAGDAIRGEYPIGVRFDKRKNRFYSRCRDPFNKDVKYLGTFKSEGEAHEAWRKCKFKFAQLLAETESDPRVVEALKIRYSELEWYGNTVPS